MNVHDDPSSSIRLIANKLVERGYEYETFSLKGSTYYSFVSPNGRSWITQGHKISYPFQTKAFADVCLDKAKANDLANRFGIPVPRSILIEKSDPVESAFQLLDTCKKVVVKPLDSSLAKGLTLDVETRNQLEKALEKARKISRSVLVQQQVVGQEIRFAVIGGKVRAALLKQTPHVIGDGVRTIADLIRKENEKRAEREVPYLSYLQLDESLIPAHFFEDTTILKKGEIRELSLGTMVRTGATFHNVLDDLHESYIQDIERLASRLGHGFVVVDMFMSDYKRPKLPTNYWFIEFNTAPYLKLFYACVAGKPFDIVSELVPLIDESVSGVPLNERDDAATSPRQVTLGCLEYVSIAEFGIQDRLAKIDTGAYSGALDCSFIEVIQRNGKNILRFSPSRESETVCETEEFYEKYVKSSNALKEKRFIVRTNVDIRGVSYPMTVSLTSRSDMKYEILIGRRFLREHNLCVDVRVNEEYDTEKEARQ